MFTTYTDLSPAEQYLHAAHFILCVLAVLVAIIPATTEKGNGAHKLGGMIYLPLALVALLFSSLIAWHESSTVLFCFNSFCAYLLLSGWRAVHETAVPALIDWAIPGSLLVLGLAIACSALFHEDDKKSFYLLFFSLNAFYLAWHDWKHLNRRVHWQRNQIFLASTPTASGAMSWIGRHVTGMVGSVIANLSVVVLTLLPQELHWIWPVVLATGALVIWWRQHEKRLRLKADMAFASRPLPPRMQGF